MFHVWPVAAALTANLVDQGVENCHKPLHRYGHGHVDAGGEMASNTDTGDTGGEMAENVAIYIKV